MPIEIAHPLRWLKVSIVLLAILVFCGTLYAIHLQKGEKADIEVQERTQIPTLGELLAMPSEELEQQDIAVVNLVCAQGLYGAKNLDINKCLEQIDVWATQARILLSEREFMFHQAPERSNYSINRWRCGGLGLFLSKIIGLSYHPDRRNLKSGGIYDTHHFQDSRDFMIHGLILEKNRGTCASMPVLYAAIARRLGYPIKFVRTRNHLFLRWVDPEGKENFNIEWTDVYVDFRSNDYYKSWPAQLNLGEIERQGYLIPLSAERTMSSFMHHRAMCLWFHGDLTEAKNSFVEAYRLDDNRAARAACIRAIEKEIQNERNSK